MAVRQNAAPVGFSQSRRADNCSTLTSVKAGVVNIIAQAPVFRGDSVAGRINLALSLAEMPKPVNNAIIARAQAWFVPRPALPQFSGLDEYTHAFQGKSISSLGASDRSPPSLYETGTSYSKNISPHWRTLGIAVGDSDVTNHDIHDSYTLVQNFRLAAHSSKMTRYNYVSEGGTGVAKWDSLKPAFWPRGRMHSMVADYESALVTGSMDLDVSAGQIPISGIGFSNSVVTGTTLSAREAGQVDPDSTSYPRTQSGENVEFRTQNTNEFGTAYPDIYAEMAGQIVATTLADIDKARQTNAFAKMLASYAGTNYSGFNNDDVIVSELMQGFQVPQELFNRPWLLDNKTVIFGQQERHASGSLADLDDSVTTGQAMVSLSINIPRAEYGGHMIATLEVMPERLYERQSDEYLYVTSADDLPNALRDSLRPEPVDIATNRRWDVKHTTPNGIAAYEPMNAKWRREATRLGGEFQQTTPGTPVTTARTAIWQPDVVDPTMNNDFWLCPTPFPQDVFSVPSNDCVEVALMQQLTITGLTQFGDELVEDNAEFLTVKAETV